MTTTLVTTTTTTAGKKGCMVLGTGDENDDVYMQREVKNSRARLWQSGVAVSNFCVEKLGKRAGGKKLNQSKVTRYEKKNICLNEF